LLFAPMLVALLPIGPLAAQQQPAAPSGPLTLLQAISLGRQQGVNAAVARLELRAANAKVAERRADLLPNISGNTSYLLQTINLDQFGIPVATEVTDPFNIYTIQLRGEQLLFDASTITRLRAARDTAVAAGLDAQAVGEIAGATAGLAYLRALS